jgi:hypothetical protein
MESSIDIITPLTRLQETAQRQFSVLSGNPTQFIDGYLMAINHAIELAQVFQARIDLRLGQEQGEIAK